MSGVTVENSTLALSGDHAKEGELLQVEGGTGWEAACQEVDKGSRGSWIKLRNFYFYQNTQLCSGTRWHESFIDFSLS